MDQNAVPTYRNHILSSLPQAEIQALKPHLQTVTFVLQQVLHEAGNAVAEVYFPESGLVSVTADTCDNGLVEVGVIGREGITGSPILLDAGAFSAHRSFIQVPGHGFKVAAPQFLAAIDSSPILRKLCLRYINFLMTQTAQTAACNARHELPARLARWLLMSHDRIEGDDLPMKQEFLSFMLGVRRAGVSVVIGRLQSSGLIKSSRGHVTIIDRARLETEACSCYQIIAQSRLRIMSPL